MVTRKLLATCLLLAAIIFIVGGETALCGERVRDLGNRFSLELPAGWVVKRNEDHKIVVGDESPEKKMSLSVVIHSTATEKEQLALGFTGLKLNGDAVLSKGRHLNYLVSFGKPDKYTPNGSVTIYGKMEAGQSLFSFQSSRVPRTQPDAEMDTKPLLDAIKQIASSLE